MGAGSSTEQAAAAHRKGLAITFAGGMFMTFDTPLLRLVDTDPWTAIVWRGLFVFLAMGGFWLWWRLATGSRDPFINGRDGYVVALLHCAANILFMTALHYTTVANLVFILALNPLFAALFSFLWLNERVNRATLIAILAALLGVVIIVWDGLGRGSAFGDMLALGCATVLGFGLTYVRRSRKNLSLSPALGALIAAGIAVPFAQQLWLVGDQWVYMALNGFVVMPMASAMLVAGPRYITAAEVAMFFLLETVLAPVWVWLVVGEVPSGNSLIGGAIILTTLALHSLHRLGTGRRRARKTG